ncbi:hypothetical protein ABFS83_04G191900 [Erythranthe nasuta]
MGMDSSIAHHHHQEMNCSSSSQTLESMLAGGTKSAAQQQENKKPRPADMDSLKCPRCDSTNTKFCYYNNYSLSQPRYFCKSCRRYWTKGGTLRNVPVGGGCRKNKRPSSASSSCSSASSRQRSQDNHHHPIVVGPTANIPSCNDDLNLAIARLQRQDNNNHDFSIWGNPNMPYHHMHDHSLIRSEFLETPLNGIPSFQYENIGMGIGMGMGNPYEEFNTTTSMAVKDEGENSKVLFGFPWQNGGGNSNTGEFDSGARVSWNGINNGSSYNNWHGLLNSPLM